MERSHTETRSESAVSEHCVRHRRSSAREATEPWPRTPTSCFLYHGVVSRTQKNIPPLRKTHFAHRLEDWRCFETLGAGVSEGLTPLPACYRDATRSAFQHQEEKKRRKKKSQGMKKDFRLFFSYAQSQREAECATRLSHLLKVCDALEADRRDAAQDRGDGKIA